MLIGAYLTVCGIQYSILMTVLLGLAGITAPLWALLIVFPKPKTT